MKKVEVSWRNRDTRCRRCGRFVDEVGDYAYATWSRHGLRTVYCAECGELAQTNKRLNNDKRNRNKLLRQTT